mgnify:CR=1 FL=1
MDEDKLEHPVAFYSRELSPDEEKFSANDREILALISFLNDSDAIRKELDLKYLRTIKS